ncbi:hypothetical protein E2C01_053203 [Portunus trituberculatus]|uniref:Uncharacterized protein n=1 Tax=Portunus trituberculatus TaxID=210409 RepID=A0A5B7GNV3_PORTR|nr:hypothetical protein [Portunus trituberculatus]
MGSERWPQEVQKVGSVVGVLRSTYPSRPPVPQPPRLTRVYLRRAEGDEWLLVWEIGPEAPCSALVTSALTALLVPGVSGVVMHKDKSTCGVCLAKDPLRARPGVAVCPALLALPAPHRCGSRDVSPDELSAPGVTHPPHVASAQDKKLR